MSVQELQRGIGPVSVPNLAEDSVAIAVLEAMRQGLGGTASAIAAELRLEDLGLDERRVVACAFSMSAHSVIGLAGGFDRVSVVKRPMVRDWMRRAVEADPSGLEFCADWGRWLLDIEGDAEAALVWTGRCVGFGAEYGGLHGRALCKAGRWGEGLRLLAGWAESEPENVGALMAYGSALRDSGRPEQGLFWLNQAVELVPGDAAVRASQCMSMLYCCWDGDEISKAHAEFGRLVGVGGAHVLRGTMVPEGRKLRVGLMSSDFRRHSCAHFLLPIVRHLDRERFEVVLVATERPGDSEVTLEFLGLADEWVDISQMPAPRAAQAISSLVDVLIDCNGLTAGHRQDVMAMHPAAITGTFLGYPATSGLTATDFRVGDVFADAFGEGLNAERDVVLLDGMWCYDPIDNPPAIRDRRSGPVRLGVFNSAAKYSEAAMGWWARNLLAYPEAVLVVKNRAFNDDEVFGVFVARMGAYGVGAERIERLEYRATPFEALDDYNLIDVQLDTVPYSGTTTTCESLLMGVPVVPFCSIDSGTHAERVSLSILNSVRAADVSIRPNTRAERFTLRERFLKSSVCDQAGYAKKFGAMLDRLVCASRVA